MSASLRSRLAPALLGLGLLAPVLASAHDAPGEYFLNDDPGLGAATPLPLAVPPPPLAEIDTLALPLPATPTSGVSILGIRFRKADGDWGPTQLGRLHLVPGATGPTLSLAWGSAEPITASPAADGTVALTRPTSASGDANRLVLRTRFGGLLGPASIQRVHPLGGSTPSRLYYAFDQAPNPATSTAFVELTEAHRVAPTAVSLPLSAATPGFHPLHLQLHNTAGARTTTVRPLHLVPSSTPSLAVAWGSGAPVAVAIDANGTATVTRPVSAPGDANRLVIRTRIGTSDGPAFAFRVQPLGGALPARLYYALDQSPVPASSPFIELTEAHRLAPSHLALDLGSATPGFHTLHLQLHDTQGGRTEQLRHLHITPSRVQTLVGLAYTFKPVGDGAPIDIELAPLTASPEPQDIVLPVPASLPAGAYTLVLQLANSQADLGSASTAELLVGGAYDIWAATALAGRDPAETGPLADPDQDRIVNLLEYAFGLDPLQPAASAGYSIQSQTTPAGGPSFLVEYRQREGGVGELGVDYTAGGLRYVVEGSTDLQTWVPYSELPGMVGNSSSHPNGDGTETIQLEVLYEQTLDTAKRVFLRLKVSVVP